MVEEKLACREKGGTERSCTVLSLGWAEGQQTGWVDVFEKYKRGESGGPVETKKLLLG